MKFRLNSTFLLASTVLAIGVDVGLRSWTLSPDSAAGLRHSLLDLMGCYMGILGIVWIGLLAAWLCLGRRRRRIQTFWLRAGLIWHGPVGIPIAAALGLIGAYLSFRQIMPPLWMFALPAGWELAVAIHLRLRLRRNFSQLSAPPRRHRAGDPAQPG